MNNIFIGYLSLVFNVIIISLILYLEVNTHKNYLHIVFIIVRMVFLSNCTSDPIHKLTEILLKLDRCKYLIVNHEIINDDCLAFAIIWYRTETTLIFTTISRPMGEKLGVQSLQLHRGLFFEWTSRDNPWSNSLSIIVWYWLDHD